jgi:hypothetical protein
MKILLLAHFFMKSLLKQKATIVMSLLTTLFLSIAWLLSDMNIGAVFKLFEDVLLTSEMFLLHLSAIFYAYEFLQKERIGGVFVLPLATGMKRSHYLLAVLLGQWSMLLLFAMILLILDTLVLFMVEGTFVWMVLWQLILYVLSSMMVSLLIILFSQFVSIMNAVIYSMTLYFLGNALDELYLYAYFIHIDPLLQKVYHILEFLIPNFALFDKQGIIVNRSVESTSVTILEPTVYFLIATTIIFLITNWKFSRKALKVGE